MKGYKCSGMHFSRKIGKDLGKREVSFTLGVELVKGFKMKGMLKTNPERNPSDNDTFLHVVKEECVWVGREVGVSIQA